MKKTTKRALSFLLTLVMLVSTMSVGFFGITSLAATNATVDSAHQAVIAVPETVYMTPSTGASTTGQYYVNNTISGGNTFTVVPEVSANNTKGYVQFYIPGATKVQMTVSTVTSSIGDVVLSGVTEGTSYDVGSNGYYSNNSIGMSISGTGITAGNTALAEWKFTVTMNDGSTRVYYAYSTLYSPYYVPVGAATRAATGNSVYAQSVAWVSGIHGFTTNNSGKYYVSVTGQEIADEGEYTDKGTYYAKTTNYAMVPMIYGVGEGSNTAQAVNAWVTASASGETLSVPSFRYFSLSAKTGTGANYGDLVADISPIANLTIDTSRYSNLNQIPNLTVGYNITDVEGAGEVWWYASDFTEVAHSYTTANNDVSNFYNYTKQESASNITDYAKKWFDGDNTTGTILKGSATGATEVGTGVEYNAVWDQAVKSDSATYDYMFKGIAHSVGKSGCDVNARAYSINYVQLKSTNVNKSTLRKAVLDCTSLNANNYTSASWNDYQTVIRAAAQRLGDPTVTNVDTSALESEKTALQTTVKLNANGGSIGTTSFNQTVGTATTPNYNVSSYTPTRTGYTFKGWSTSATATSGSTSSVTAGLMPTLYATWEISKYTVTWDVNGTKTTETYEYGKTPSYKNGTPTKPSDDMYKYTFSGWDKELSPVTGDITYTAQFSSEQIGFTVTWKNYDGTVLETDAVILGDVPTYDGANPTRPGDAQYKYTFTGWSPSVGAVTGDTTYTAQFSQTTNQYKVTWKNWDGTELKTQTVKYGDIPTAPANPSRPGNDQFSYTFDGWDKEIVAVTGDVTYTAKFTSTTNTYNIVWVNDNGETLETDLNVPYATMPTYDGETPTKASSDEFTYTFAGWDPEVVAVTGPATYTATYTSEKRSYTITWKNDDGTVIDTTTVKYGEVPTHADATKANTAEYTYTFAGWDTTPVAVTGEATYTAQFTAKKNSYTITWLNDDGTTIDTTTVEYGTVPTHAAPTKAADVQYTYTFEGWTPEVVAVTGAATYTATYSSTVNEYTIIFKNEDGTELQSGKVAYGEKPVYTGEEPTKASTAQYSYAFIGWDPEIAKVTGDATYTAQFEESTNVYVVTWKDGNGNVLDTDNVPYGTTPSYTGETPTKAQTDKYDYTFNGTWDPEIDEVTGDATYTAQFDSTVRKYTITWKNADGTLLVTSEVEYDEVPVYEGTTPTKESTPKYSYTFKDWGNVVAVTGPATYIAQYTEILRAYTVTWVNADGTVLETDENVLYGATPSFDGTTPTKAKDAQYTYTFDKWSPEVVAVTGDVTYTATYTETLNKYDVVWKHENGTVLETDTDVEYGTTPNFDGTTPTKAQTAEYTYTFDGWTPAVESVKGNAEYIATFKAEKRSYTITWLNDDGTTIDTTTVEYGAVPTHADATKENTAEYTYTFAGWTPDVAKVTGDATYKATFTAEKNSYTITWKNDDGTTIDTTTVEYGVVPTHADATKANTAEYTYTFAGWDPEVVSVTGDATYTAKFNATKNSYTITWQNEDGTTIDTTTVEYGEVPTHADPVKANTAEYTYTFAGWDPAVVSVTGDATYKATFTAEKNSYTITWKNDDGSVIDTTTVEYGTVPTHAAPTKAATAEYTYSFAGWDTTPVAVTGEATYTATYTATANVYTITWVGYNKTVTTDVAFGSAITDVPEVPEKPDHIGVWESFPETMPAGDITVNAVYSQNVIIVTWVVNGVTVKTDAVKYGDRPVYTGAEPTKESSNTEVYSFIGWAATEGGEVIDELPEADQSTGNKTYYAVFDAETRYYEITWVAEGKEPVTEKYTYGATPVYKGEDPTKAADAQYTYTFAGWGDVVAVTGDATYTAQFSSTVNKYTITWIVNGTPVIDEVEYGQTPVYPNGTPAKDATDQYTYTFTGWSPAVEAVTGPATYTAQFDATVNTYTVTWVIDGKETTETYEYGAMPSHEDPTKAADAQYTYTFTNWTPAIETVTGNARYEAQFDSTVNEYTIVFQNEDGTVLQSGKVAYGDTPAYTGETPTKATTAQYTYTFDGWTTTIVPVTGDATYTAKYSSTVNEYTIVFKNADGTVLQTGNVAYGETPVYAGETPVKTGNAQFSYVFSGWTPSVVEVTGDAIYTAVFAEKTNTYTVTWNNEDGTNLETDEAVPYGTMPQYNGKQPAKAATAQYTYTFAGWDADVSEVTGNVTYTATFSEAVNSYEITWVDDNGSVIDTTTVAYGTVPTHAAPTKAPDAQYTYAFTGWTPEVVAVTGAATYTATYSSTVNEYTVVWVVEGETVETDENVPYGTAPSYDGAEPAKDATAQYTYTFAGWDPAVSDVTGDVTYTAKFTATVNEYTITWLDENGSVIDTTTVAYGTVPTLADPEKAATAEYTYTFAGWDTTPVAVTGEATYKATYTATKNSYTITWIVNGTETTETYEYGILPEFKGSTDITEVGATYEFLGWDKEITTVTCDETYTAVYDITIIAYEVTWVDGNGDIIYSEFVQFGKTPVYNVAEYGTPVKDASKTEVYTFDKWSPAITEVAGAVTYTAEFTASPRTYTVTWYIEGEFFKTAELKYGDTLPVYSIPSDKEIEGYTMSWDTSYVVMPAEDIEINTKLTPKRYPVFWIVNNVTVHSASVEYGSAIPSWTIPTMEGYTGKWVGVPETMPAGSVSIYAEYSPIKYTVMWRIDGVQNTDTAIYGTEYVLKLENSRIPEAIRVTVGGSVLSEDLYSYNAEIGIIIIAASAVKGNINIIEKTSSSVVSVITTIYGGSSTNKNDTTALRQAYHTTIVADKGYVLPEEIAIYVDGLYVSRGYTYNAKTGKLTINAETIVGEVEIYVECVQESINDDPDRIDDPSECTCNCHSANVFIKFFFNIANFFRKLFGMTQYKYCACDVAHW